MKESHSLDDKNSNIEKNNMNKKLLKIIYFDENSAGDYLNIFHGGAKKEIDEENKSTESYWERNTSISLKLTGSISLLLGLLGLFTLNEAVSQYISGAISFIGGLVSISPFIFEKLSSKKDEEKRLVSTQVKSQVLTQFLENAKENEKKVIPIKEHRIKFPENSFTFMKNVSPVMNFMNLESLETDTLPFNLSKLGEMIDDLKGYYSVIAVNKNGATKILRFNSQALRNNYRLSDLLIMDLTFYTVKVGTVTNGDDVLSFENEFKNQFDMSQGNDLKSAIRGDESNKTNEIGLYDVILAGVSEHIDE